MKYYTSLSLCWLKYPLPLKAVTAGLGAFSEEDASTLSLSFMHTHTCTTCPPSSPPCHPVTCLGAVFHQRNTSADLVWLLVTLLFLWYCFVFVSPQERGWTRQEAVCHMMYSTSCNNLLFGVIKWADVLTAHIFSSVAAAPPCLSFFSGVRVSYRRGGWENPAPVRDAEAAAQLMPLSFHPFFDPSISLLVIWEAAALFSPLHVEYTHEFILFECVNMWICMHRGPC